MIVKSFLNSSATPSYQPIRGSPSPKSTSSPKPGQSMTHGAAYQSRGVVQQPDIPTLPPKRHSQRFSCSHSSFWAEEKCYESELGILSWCFVTTPQKPPSDSELLQKFIVWRFFCFNIEATSEERLYWCRRTPKPWTLEVILNHLVAFVV